MGGLRLSLLLPLLLLQLFSAFSPSSQEDVTVSINGVTTVARTDDTFVCATMDWWPAQKCNYGQCVWANASILTMDLENPILHNAIKAFKSMRIRIGGSLQDQVVYKVGPKHPKCRKFKLLTDGLFGFSGGCLNMCKWDKLNNLFNRTGATVTFGLNALIGRTKAPIGSLYEGDWDPTNARDLINYTISKGYNVKSWELGNEVSGSGVAAKVDATQYGKDLIVLKGILNDLYNGTGSEAQLLAPGGFFESKWYADMLMASGPGVLDVVTHHVYNLGAGNDADLINKVQDPYYLDGVAQTYRDVDTLVKTLGPWSSAWVSESGGAYNSGGKDVSNRYVDSFWYLDQLGMTSTFDHKVFCRQALVGGNYALLKTNSFIPNPDFYSALLWHKLMGSGVLHTTLNGSPYLRAYSHCSREEGAVTLLLINLSNSTRFDVSVVNDMNLYPSQLTGYTKSFIDAQGQREEYHLTPKGGDIQSNVMLLNGQPLNVTSTGDIPEMYPITTDASAPLHIAPLSIAFIKFEDFKAPACQ